MLTLQPPVLRLFKLKDQDIGFVGWLDGSKVLSQPVNPLEDNEEVFGCPLCGCKVRLPNVEWSEAFVVIACTMYQHVLLNCISLIISNLHIRDLDQLLSV